MENFTREWVFKILELKNTISDSKTLIYGFNRQLDTAEQMISKLEDRSVQNIKIERKKEKIFLKKKKDKTYGTCV